MSQNTIVLPTSGIVSGLQMTQATNNALDTLNTLASGSAAPVSPEAGQLWHDTANNQLKIRSLDNTTWMPFLQLSEAAYQAAPFLNSQISGDVNRIINGGMSIDQVNEGGSYTVPVNNTPIYAVDQWQAFCLSSTAGGVTAQRVTDAPPGFSHSLKVTVGAGASSVGTTDYLGLQQPVEAANLSDLAFGTSNALPVSLSFWVKSSVTGTYSVALGNTTGGNQQLVASFSIATAGVWQKVTLANILGDQAGTWASGAAAGLNLTVMLASGSNYQTTTLNSWQAGYYLASSLQANGVLTTSGATFQLSGVMLNAGSFALPHQKRNVQSELQLCERYYQKSFQQGVAVAQNTGAVGNMVVQAAVNGIFGINVTFRGTMRAAPSITTYNPAAANANWRDFSNSADRTASLGNISDRAFFIFGAGGVALSTNNINYSASARM